MKLREAAIGAKYKRILLKLSGEALMGDDPYGINRQTIETIVGEIAAVARLGVELGVVIGGGNIFRGVAPGAAGMDRATADYMGMLATVMNALALQDAMRRAGLDCRVQSALNIAQVVEPCIRGYPLASAQSARGLFGEGGATPEAIAAASPTTYIGPNFAPTFFIHGTADTTVLPSSSIDFFTKLKAANVPTALKVIQGAAHAFDNGALDAVDLMAQSIDLFMDRLFINPKPYASFGGGPRGERVGRPGGGGPGGAPGGGAPGGAPRPQGN